MESVRDNLNIEILFLVDEVIEQDKSVKAYDLVQIYGSIIFIIGFVSYHYFQYSSLNLDRILRSYEFFIVVLILFIYNIALAKSRNKIDEKLKKNKGKLKDKMLLSICYCNEYCKCKDDLNKYLKSKGVKFI